jgi:hypothetical protein
MTQLPVAKRDSGQIEVEEKLGKLKIGIKHRGKLKEKE